MQINNHTQVSNYFIDKIMNKVSGNATKIFLSIARKTIGWHKETDMISQTQLKILTGLSINSIKKSIKELKDIDIIKTERLGKGKNIKTFFEINYDISNFNISNIDTLKADNMSKIDTINALNVSNIDTTKDNIKENKIKESDDKSSSSYKKIYNEYLLKIYKDQSIINDLIFKSTKEIKQHAMFIKRFESEAACRQFLDVAIKDKWICETKGLLPSILNSQFSEIKAKMYIKNTPISYNPNLEVVT
jgi:phage replication O-like protein O